VTGWESRERHGNNRIIAARVSNGRRKSRTQLSGSQLLRLPTLIAVDEEFACGPKHEVAARSIDRRINFARWD
jgi:hypothetical protein